MVIYLNHPRGKLFQGLTIWGFSNESSYSSIAPNAKTSPKPSLSVFSKVLSRFQLNLSHTCDTVFVLLIDSFLGVSEK